MLLCLTLAALADPPGVDRHGFPLPTGAVTRLGSSRLRGRWHVFDLTPDGKTVITTGNPPYVEGDEVKFWDVATGEPRGTISHRWAGTPVVSPDGTRLFVPGITLGYWNLADRRMLWGDTPAHAGGNYSTFAISPDGKLVAAGGDHMHLLDAATGEAVRTIERRQGSNSLHSIAFSPDGTVVAVEDHYEVRLWDVATGGLVRAMEGLVAVNALAFTPDGKYLLAGLWDNKKGGVPIWDVATGKRVRSLAGHDSPMTCAVAVSPDGKWVATAGEATQTYGGGDHDIHLYDFASGERRHVLPGHYGPAGRLRFTADSKTLLTGGDVVRFWDVASGKQLRQQEGHESLVVDLRFVGDTLVTAGLDNTVRGWNPRTGEPKWVRPAGPGRPLAVVLAPAADRVCSVQIGGELAVVTEVATGKELGRVAAEPYRLPQFTPAGDALVAVRYTGPAVLPLDGGAVRPQETPIHGMAALGSDGKTLAFVLSVATPEEAEETRKRSRGVLSGPQPPFAVVLWDVAAGREVKRFRVDGISTHDHLAWSPDGTRIAFGRYGVSVIDVAAGTTTPGRRRPANDSETFWSPDGRRYAYTKDGSIVGVEAATRRTVFRLPLGAARSYHLAWSPDGKLLAAATGTTVLVYPVPADR